MVDPVGAASSEPTLFLRTEFTIVDLGFDPGDEELVLDLDGAHKVTLRLKLSPNRPQDAICFASSMVPLGQRMLAGFEAIAQGKLPEGHKPVEEDDEYGVYNDGTFDCDPVLIEPWLPQPMVDFNNTMRDELLDAVRRSARWLRWRCNCSGEHNPFRHEISPVEWSLDGEKWFTLPGGDIDFAYDPYKKSAVPLSIKSEAEQHVRAGADEPIAHSLLREAWDQRRDNPRSGLVIGIAALEVGVRHCIAALAPSTSWLVEKLQSPPIPLILQEYLPLLDAKHRFEGKVLPPPKDMIDRLKDAITQRNRIAHFSGEPLRSWDVQEVLEDVRDVLWLLDYYQGNDWAPGYMRVETLEALLEAGCR
jgi:hypothetical protein